MRKYHRPFPAKCSSALKNQYVFMSPRLGFRNWRSDDLPAFARMNTDPEVMRYFPGILTEQQSAGFIQRMWRQYEKTGYTYFATELLETGDFIGFIGLADQDYPTVFNPATDIGWRLKKSAWGNGLATEGARRCLELAFSEWSLDRVVAVCPVRNTASEKVMQRIGMTKRGEFAHPALTDVPDLVRCCWYQIDQPPSVRK